MSEPTLALNNALLSQVVAATEEISRTVPSATPPSTLDLLKWPGVLTNAQADQGQLMSAAASAFPERLATTRGSAQFEGKRLTGLLEQQLADIEEIVNFVRPLGDNIMQLQQQRLQRRLAELELRSTHHAEQEIALLAQRADIREELDRLSIHVAEAHQLLSAKGLPAR